MGLPNIGPVELIIVLVIALLVLGPGKLPEVGSAFGKVTSVRLEGNLLLVDAATSHWVREIRRSSPLILRRLHTLTQATAPNTLSDVAEPALKGAPADPVADRV